MHLSINLKIISVNLDPAYCSMVKLSIRCGFLRITEFNSINSVLSVYQNRPKNAGGDHEA